MSIATLLHCLLAVSLLSGVAHAQLSKNFYKASCPSLETTVRAEMKHAVGKERRMGASLLRLFFHDCFVQGCDGSILLDDGGEKSAGPNVNSLRGFDAIDTIKASVEAKCPGVVSCADILALAARDGTFLLGGPHWDVLLGRRDSTTANRSLAKTNLPLASSSLATLITNAPPRDRIYNDSNIEASFANRLRKTCPKCGRDSNLASIDTKTAMAFDAAYFQNLIDRRGLFHSDQELFNGGSQDALVRHYSSNPAIFRDDFARAMMKMGNIKPLTGTAGQIRENCRVVNR
ncbi:hypothetical protein ACQ4PT_019747 [Festuca glaucescens]